MDEILSDKTMDRIERIDKLEAILSAATLLPNDPVSVLNTAMYWYDWENDNIDQFHIIFRLSPPSQHRILNQTLAALTTVFNL